jgi:hypothetical protein
MRRLARAPRVGEECETQVVASEECRHVLSHPQRLNCIPSCSRTVSHFKHVPLRTIVKLPHSGQASPT